MTKSGSWQLKGAVSPQPSDPADPPTAAQMHISNAFHSTHCRSSLEHQPLTRAHTDTSVSIPLASFLASGHLCFLYTAKAVNTLQRRVEEPARSVFLYTRFSQVLTAILMNSSL